jgi:hypothetical protein
VTAASLPLARTTGGCPSVGCLEPSHSRTRISHNPSIHRSSKPNHTTPHRQEHRSSTQHMSSMNLDDGRSATPLDTYGHSTDATTADHVGDKLAAAMEHRQILEEYLLRVPEVRAQPLFRVPVSSTSRSRSRARARTHTHTHARARALRREARSTRTPGETLRMLRTRSKCTVPNFGLP